VHEDTVDRAPRDRIEWTACDEPHEGKSENPRLRLTGEVRALVGSPVESAGGLRSALLSFLVLERRGVIDMRKRLIFRNSHV
jgi:hypothetical protein